MGRTRFGRAASGADQVDVSAADSDDSGEVSAMVEMEMSVLEFEARRGWGDDERQCLGAATMTRGPVTQLPTSFFAVDHRIET